MVIDVYVNCGNKLEILGITGFLEFVDHPVF
jgi:hypothetical protein